MSQILKVLPFALAPSSPSLTTIKKKQQQVIALLDKEWLSQQARLHRIKEIDERCERLKMALASLS